MQFDDLRYFYEIAHCGNFSKAAEKLNITQPNLSKHISALESELGTRLFDRSTHHCRLTNSGMFFMNRTEDLFYQLQTNIEDTHLRSRNQYKQIYIGNASGEHPTQPVLKALRQYNSTSKTHRYILVEDTYVEMISKLKTREFDLIITTDRNARYTEEFDYLELAPMQMMLAVHKSNPKSANPDLKPSDCIDEIVFIAPPDGKNAPPSSLEDFTSRTNAELNLIILHSPSDLIKNVRIYSGVAIVPNTIDTSLYPDIVFYAFEPRHDNSCQSLVWRKNETSRAVLKFIEEVHKQLDDSKD